MPLEYTSLELLRRNHPAACLTWAAAPAGTCAKAAQRGFRASGVERSRPLAMFARKYANCPVLEADFTLLDMAAHLRGHSLHRFVGPPRAAGGARLLGRLLNALAPRGLLFVSLKEGTHPTPRTAAFHPWQQQALESVLRKRGDPLHFSRTVSALRPDETSLGWVVDARGGTDHVRPA